VPALDLEKVHISGVVCAVYDASISSALARVFYTVGAKVILASRNVQQLERLKFQLDSEPDSKVKRIVIKN
jgi:NADP-dependent 3-hydroxy acid dehydrogenase YdfG